MSSILKFLKYKLVPVILSALLALGLAACGKTQESNEAGWVYMPEFLSIEGGENISWHDVLFTGDDLYYISYDWDMEAETSVTTLNKYSIVDGTTEEMKLSFPNGANLNGWIVDEDGCLYAALVVWDWNETTGVSNNTYMVAKYDAQGNELFVNDFTDLLTTESYLDGIVVDGEGRIYISEHAAMWLFDAEGNPAGTVNMGSGMNSWINSYCKGTDGRIYVAVTSYDESGSSTTLSAVNFDTKSLEDGYTGFPSAEILAQNAEGTFLVHDGTSVYEYDLKTQEKEKLFDWLDCDINGNYVSGLGALSDGRIIAAFRDWRSNDSGILAVNKVSADQVTPKQQIVLGMLYQDMDIETAVVNFNKNNDTYRVTIRQYMDYDSWSDTTVSDALTRLNNDITSDNCPDILSLNGIDIQQLAAKGVFEDLSPYLEQSSLDRSDMLENVMEAFTYDGKLICIPDSFGVETIIGSAAQVGEQMGWTLDDMMAFADAHPEAELFDGMSKESMMSYCLNYNMNVFVDWETGKCSFDTEAFKSLLKFVSRFQSYKDMTYEEGQPSMPERIQSGEVLLADAYISSLDSIQLYVEMFGGDVTCIGYPNVDGSSGAVLSPSGAYAITTRSKVKEGAWAFIESYLTREESQFSSWGFPNSKSELERMADEEVNVVYVLDENGDPMLDENGNPVVEGQGTHGVGWGNWMYYYRVPTQEEVDMVLDLITSAKIRSGSSEQILSIINEEAGAFFQGQKSIDDVASTIQNRVQVYVDENR